MVLVRQLLKILSVKLPHPSAGDINEDPTPSTSVEITNNEMANAPSPEAPQPNIW